MGKISNITNGRSFPYNLLELLSFSNWLREFKYDRQRLKRGWSDRDTWGGGEYILEVTSGVLKKLCDEKSNVDWDQYFATNYPNNLGYKSLGEVAKDIDDYLAFDAVSYMDNLPFDLNYGSEETSNGMWRIVNLNTDKENKLIKSAIDKNHKERTRLWKKASKAMKFVAQNFHGLWD